VSASGDDAQRNLERKALRNVRGLLDRMEDDERDNRRGVARIAIGAVVVAVVVAALVVLWMGAHNAAPSANPVVIPPVQKGSAK
jgi:hypothetical protein